MPKETGLGDNFFVDEYDVSGATAALGRIGGGPALLDLTDITQGAFERGGGRLTGSIEWTAFFETTTGHGALSGLPTTARIATYCRGTSLGDWAASVSGVQIGYDPTRDAEGNLSLGVSVESSTGTPLEWGLLHTAGKRTDTGATNGTGVDHGAASTYGLSAYLHVLSFTGTDVTMKIQESSDDGGADAYADVVGGAFTEVTDVTSERISTALDLSVERYLRVVTETTGGFSECTFVVMVSRHLTEVTYS